MPKDKKPFERYQAIHDKFRRSGQKRGVVKLSALAEQLGVSVRQLHEDMNVLREMGAKFEYVAADRGWHYAQDNAFFVVEGHPFNKDEALALRTMMDMAGNLDLGDIPLKELPKVIKNIYGQAQRWHQPIELGKVLYFDPLPRYAGAKHLSFMLQCIERSIKIQFDYQAFHARSPKTVVFDPWFLRYYDRRWYVGGFSHDPSERFVRVFPLERIVGQPSETGYFHDRPPEYDAATYWQHIYGITIEPGQEVQEIILEFSPIEGLYFLTTPFFEPFQVLEQNSERVLISMQLKPNRDLVRKLASLGKEVRVLAPNSLLERLVKFHQDALEGYTQKP